MATRRIVNSEKTLLDQDDQPEEKSNISPAVPKYGPLPLLFDVTSCPKTLQLTEESDVIFKLLAFTLAMVVIPIGSYFLTVNTIFKGMLF